MATAWLRYCPSICLGRLEKAALANIETVQLADTVVKVLLLPTRLLYGWMCVDVEAAQLLHQRYVGKLRLVVCRSAILRSY
jgi:hypothetical protein